MFDTKASLEHVATFINSRLHNDSICCLMSHKLLNLKTEIYEAGPTEAKHRKNHTFPLFFILKMS